MPMSIIKACSRSPLQVMVVVLVAYMPHLFSRHISVDVPILLYNHAPVCLGPIYTVTEKIKTVLQLFN